MVPTPPIGWGAPGAPVYPGSMASVLRLPAQGRELASVIASAARAYRVSPIVAARLARRVRAALGFEYAEALRAGLLDPAVPDGDRMQFMSKNGTSRLQDRLNPAELRSLTEEKLVFQRYCEALGLPVPRLYAAVGRSTSWTPAGPLGGADEFARCVRADLPEEFVVKPSAGFHGDGVRVLRRRGDLLCEAGGRTLSARELHAELTGDDRHGIFLVQERLRNHPDVARLGNGEALQTLRIVSLVGRDGSVRILRARLRIALGSEPIDNWRGGTTGNGAMPVDQDGMLGGLTLPRADGCGPQPAREAPGTGTRLPDWDAVRALVWRAALAFQPIRTIGWDVALTDRGPVLVEANQVWDPFPDPAPEIERAMSEA